MASSLDSEIKKISTFTIVSAIISNLFLIEFIFKWFIIIVFGFLRCCILMPLNLLATPSVMPRLSSEMSKEGELSILPELCRFFRQMKSFKKFLIFLTKTDLL